MLQTYPVASLAVVSLFGMAAAAAFWNWTVAVCELAVAVCLLVAGLVRMRNEFRGLKSSVAALNERLSADEKNNLQNFPLPVLVFDASDRILWYSRLFESELLSEKTPDRGDVKVFTNGLGLGQIRETSEFAAEVGGKDYLVFPGHIDYEGKPCYALYYLDVTEMQTALRAYSAAKPAVALIAVDSIDEFYRACNENEYAEITSAVERLTESWFRQYSGILRKLGTGRFIAVVPESELQKMIAAKFNVLEKVRNYTYNGASIGITLSGGVGRGDGLSEAEAAARQALDMALGRGGDQVALKDSEQYVFFGGLSRGVEKRAKVRTRVVASAMAELISGADNILLMGHKFSDLDCIGSAFGMYRAVRRLGKEARIAVNRKTSLASALIDYLEQYEPDCFSSPAACEHFISDNTLLILTDTHKASFLDAPELYEKIKKVIVIDHHRKTVEHIANAVIFYHEPYASSACEMVTELLQYIYKKPVVDSVCANALLAGISLDTKDFVLRTGVRTFEAAAYLRSRGADTVTVKRFFADSMEARKQRGQIVMAAELYKNCAISAATVKSDEIRLIAAQAADELLSVSQVAASFVLFKTGDVSNISARSMGDVNVQLITEALGGGGHQTMAAAQLPGVSLEEAGQRLRAAIDGYYDSL